MGTVDSKVIIDSYLKRTDWRVNENSNSPYSFGGLNKYIIAEVSKQYWLDTVYTKKIADTHRAGRMHIHDLGGCSLYCSGYSLRDILIKGVRGVPNIPVSSPAKHFDSILSQIANLATIFQNEIMGAVAFNSFDTLLAPFVKQDNLNYKQVEQCLQNFIFAINSNSRAGAEPAFSNITLDLFPPNDLIDSPVIIGGVCQDFAYRSCQKEQDMINRAFCALMLKGDSNGRPFAYPIPTYNIHKGFKWDNPNNELLWEMAGRYGYPYFANYINSEMDASDARSMCCRLRLDLSELKKRSGGLFGSGDSTGSIGVVTINLPRIAYTTQNNKKRFFSELDKVLHVAKDSLETKRKWIEEHIIKTKAIPAFCEYVGKIDNYFSTIGVVGMNEMCENFFQDGTDILSDKGHDFAIEVGSHIRGVIQKFQVDTGNFYNYEATPAESTCYRLAKKDVEEFDDIAVRGTKDAPYYTNSCHIPVSRIDSINETFKHQEPLQTQFTGGTVIHIYLNGAISGDKAKSIVRSCCENYKVPYVSLSPINRYCTEHGYIENYTDKCPKCGKDLDIYQRITGYLRRVDFFNDGKKSEFAERKQLNECESQK